MSKWEKLAADELKHAASQKKAMEAEMARRKAAIDARLGIPPAEDHAAYTEDDAEVARVLVQSGAAPIMAARATAVPLYTVARIAAGVAWMKGSVARKPEPLSEAQVGWIAQALKGALR